MKDEVVECPCYGVCSSLGVEMRRWCRYHKSELPPPGVQSFDPKETWCPAGVQANLLMLGYMLAHGAEGEEMEEALGRVRQWAREMREQRAGYQPADPGRGSQAGG